MDVGFIGLGSMGTPIAANLRKAGHNLTVYNRSRQKASDFVAAAKADTNLQFAGRVAEKPEEAVKGDVVFSLLMDDKAIEDVFFSSENGSTLIEKHAPQTVHICLSTISVRLAKKLSAAYEKAGRHYLSATVMGRPDVAERGELMVMVAGDAEQIKKCQPLFDAIGKITHNFGDDPSSSNVVKVSANFMLSSMIHTMAEAFALVRKNGVDERKFYEIMTREFFASPIYEKYGKIMVDRQFDSGAFTVKGQEKDTRLALECAQDAQVPLTFASAIENTFLTAIGRGYGNDDPCVIARVIAQNAGIKD